MSSWVVDYAGGAPEGAKSRLPSSIKLAAAAKMATEGVMVRPRYARATVVSRAVWEVLLGASACHVATDRCRLPSCC